MNKFQPHIIPVYPPHNELIFEEWFAEEYKGCNTDRELLPVFFTSYWVNNNYGNDLKARGELHEFLSIVDKSKKYFVPIQYDDGSMINWDSYGLDVLEFNMSKTNGIMLPLLCQPHPYTFSGGKKYLVNFIGSRTHPIRNELEKYQGKEGWYISYERHEIEDYCRIISESVFTLCPRGYGTNSFRICESLQYGSIPIYLSDSSNHVVPFNLNFYSIGLLLEGLHSGMLDVKIASLTPEQIATFYENIPIVYNRYYTYGGCFNEIIKSLETECDLRKEKGEVA